VDFISGFYMPPEKRALSLEEHTTQDPLSTFCLTLSVSEAIAFCELESTALQQFNDKNNKDNERANRNARMRFEELNAQIEESKRLFCISQVELAKRLEQAFSTGDYNNNHNNHTSRYRFWFLQNGIYGTGRIAKDQWTANYYAKKVKPETKDISYIIRTNDLYNKLGWFSSIRLFILRLNRVLAFSNNAFLNTFSKLFFPFVYLSFSYALDLLVDSAVLLKSAITKDESVLDTFFKDGRASRMANAAVWLTCNIVCFIVTAGILNIAFNLATFVFDVFNETYRYQYEIKKYENLQKKIDKRIAELQNINIKSQDYRKTHEKELLQLQYAKQQLNKKMTTIKWSNRWNIACCIGIVVGMVLFVSFPPATTVAFLGALAAFSVGSLCIGLGKKVIRSIVSLSKQKISANSSSAPVVRRNSYAVVRRNSYHSSINKKLENASELGGKNQNTSNKTIAPASKNTQITANNSGSTQLNSDSHDNSFYNNRPRTQPENTLSATESTTKKLVSDLPSSPPTTSAHISPNS